MGGIFSMRVLLSWAADEHDDNDNNNNGGGGGGGGGGTAVGNVGRRTSSRNIIEYGGSTGPH